MALQKGNEVGILIVEVERFNNSLKKKLKSYEQIYKERKYFSKFKILYISNFKVSNDVIDIVNIKFNEINKL